MNEKCEVMKLPGKSWSRIDEPDSKDRAVDCAYDEFRNRRAAGEAVDVDRFCEGFPAIHSALRLLIEALQMCDDHPAMGSQPAVVSQPAAVSPPVAPPLDETAWPHAGDDFLGLRLKRSLGRGAFARVYLATETDLGDRPVAVKIAHHGGAEARTLGRLEHRNVVPIYSVKEEEATGLTAVCMPYLGNATLHDVLNHVRSNRLPARAETILSAIRARAREAPAAAVDTELRKGTYVSGIVHLGAQVADALAYVHERGILHRDLKPSNVLLTPEGRPMLLDFNLACDRGVNRDRLGGTLPYMAPEHLRATFPPAPAAPTKRGADAVDERSDIFALGVMLYELLSGAHPFSPYSLSMKEAKLCAVLLRHQEGGARPLHRVNPQVSARLAHLIDRCLAVDPAERPASARELAGELRRSQRSLGPWMARHAAAVCCGLLLLVSAGTYGAFRLAQPPPSAQRLAEDARYAFTDGRAEDAESLASQALAQDADSLSLRLLLARAQVRLGKTFEAEANLKKVEELGVSGAARALRAYNLMQMPSRPVPDALLFNQAALDAGFETAALHNNVAYCAMRRNELALAEKSLDRAVQLDPSLQAAWLNRVFLEMMHTRRCPDYLPLRGIADFERALTLGPVSGEYYAHAAYLCAAVAGRTVSWSTSGSWVLVAAHLAAQEKHRLRDRGRPTEWGGLDPREYQTLAVAYFAKAIAGGYPAAEIGKERAFQSLLATRPELRALRTNGVLLKQSLYLDPLGDR